jgi:hypothetical protein
MNDRRYDVTFYLEDKAAEAFEEYRQKKGLTAYEGVSFLVDDFLVKGNKADKKSSSGHLLKERMGRVEKAIDSWVSAMFRYARQMEKMNEQISELQCEVSKLRRLSGRR